MSSVLELHAVSASWYPRQSVGGYGRASSVSLHAGHGEWVYVAGPNGVGKSTLLEAIAGTASYIFGGIVVDGVSLTLEEPRDRFLAGVSYVPQVAQLIGPLSVDDCTALIGVKREGVVNEVALEDLYTEFQDRGLVNGRKCVNGRVFDLLLGVAVGPSVLLLDEIRPAVADPEEAARVYWWIRDLVPWTTVLFTEHDIDVALDIADRVLWLKKEAEGPEEFDPSRASAREEQLRESLGRGDLEEELVSSGGETPAWRGILNLGQEIRTQVVRCAKAYRGSEERTRGEAEIVDAIVEAFPFLDATDPAEELSGGQRIVLSWLLLEFTGLGRLPDHVREHLDRDVRRKMGELERRLGS